MDFDIVEAYRIVVKELCRIPKDHVSHTIDGESTARTLYLKEAIHVTVDWTRAAISLDKTLAFELNPPIMTPEVSRVQPGKLNV